MNRVLVFFIVVLSLCSNPAVAQRGPIRVFILAGESSMEGKGAVAHLLPLATSKETKGEFGHLRKGNKWTARHDVWIAYDRTKGGRKVGDLTVGYGSAENQIGTELGFGRVVGEATSEQVLLIKCCWGGANLKEAFLPPSAGGPGPHYIKMINEIRNVLGQLRSHFPKSVGKKYQLAGFVWFQGWNDSEDSGNSQYSEQLGHLIRDVRSELSAPNLPFVIGELGQAGTEPNNAVIRFRTQQKAVADLPEFINSVSYVPTGVYVDPRFSELYEIFEECKWLAHPLPKDSDERKEAWAKWEPFKAEWDARASDKPEHYFGSGEVFYRIGEAFGHAMLKLMQGVEPGPLLSPERPRKPRIEKPVAGTRIEAKTKLIEYINRRKDLQPKIDTAIDRGVVWLASKQLRDGAWGNQQNKYVTGETALAVYTLLKCGQGPEQEHVKRGLDFILRHETKQTYSLGCVLMALEAAGAKKYRARIRELHKHLISIQKSNGGWSYSDVPFKTDLSNTQYAALGLRSARLAGFKTPPETLRKLAEYTLRCQEKPKMMQLPASVAKLEEYALTKALTGGFSYREPAYRAAKTDLQDSRVTGSMTCAGLSILAIVRDLYGKRVPRATGRRMKQGIMTGENFLRVNWSIKKNPGQGAHHLYYLYGLERVGALLLKEVLGGHPWFIEGADHLLKAQSPQGNWGNGAAETCFSLLFLQRATWRKGGVSRRQASASSHQSSNGDVHLLGTGTVRLSVWVSGFSDKTKRRFRSTKKQSNIRIIRVEHLVDGEVIASVDGDTTHDWRNESYANLHQFHHNGNYKITARIHVLPPGVLELNSDIELEVLESKPFTVYVQAVRDPLLGAVESANDQGLWRDVTLVFSASSIKEHGRAAKPFMARDSHEGTSWVAEKTDENPTLTVTVKRGVVASTLLISPAPIKSANGEIASIEVIVNGKRRTYVAKPALGRGVVKIDLGKRRSIKSIMIRLTKATPDTQVGIAEIYLLN